MPDPADPIQPEPVPVSGSGTVPPPPPAPEMNASTLDLPSNIAAALACVPLIGGIIFYVMEKRDNFVRFYAMQSIIFGGAWLLFNIASAVVRGVFWAIPGIGAVLVFFWQIVNALIQIAFLVVWIVATVKAFSGVRWEIPYIGPTARKQTEGGTVLSD
jgi:uncharacterized membrane protein